ncbi:sensor histidine kinase [Deinococcus sp. A31D244]|uniref:sensor histidine kinase n=1 Tax=Deinococcus sp. A31D244 TaxID=3397675 RepID=UPI0039E082E3
MAHHDDSTTGSASGVTPEGPPWQSRPARSGPDAALSARPGAAVTSAPDQTPAPPRGLPASAVRAALDVMPQQMAVLDTQGVILLCNRAWNDFMTENGGDPATCGPGVNYLRVCENALGPSADEGQEVAGGLRRVLGGQADSFSAEYPCHSPHEERWFRLIVTPFDDGPTRFLMITHENITERRHAEIREADLDAEVRQEVAQRTLDLRSEMDELDSFIGSVSHDLRAPVRHIQGFLTLLRRRLNPRLDDEDRRLLGTLDGAALRLQSMIDELLKLARVAQTSLPVRDLNLTPVVLRAWANIAPETEGRQIEWVAGDLPVVRGDPQLLTLAFENLLGNAVKYTSGRPHARIEVGARDGGDHWVVFVQDDGVGFDSRYAGRLFSAFQRLHTEREFSGVGMGLVNVKRIVTRHGGQVWAESQPGQGATFHVSFPKPAPADT